MKHKIHFIIILLFISVKSNAQTILDIDGNSYNTITIGTQTWMQENLKTTRYNNGIAIPTTSLSITNDTNAKYQWAYNQDTSNISIYGRLYTWNIVNSNINVCPMGWRAPDNSDWELLSNFLGGDSIAGGKMKEVGTTHWSSTDTSVTNSSGFTALGSGFRGNPTGFGLLNESALFWSSTPFGITGNFPRGNTFRLNAQNNTFTNSVAVANNGMAVRCIKNKATNIDNSSLLNEIKIFPNPATNQIIISFEQNKNYQLTIYDLLGNSIYKQKLVDKVNDIEIDFLPNGTYLIQLTDKDQIVSYPLLKQ